MVANHCGSVSCRQNLSSLLITLCVTRTEIDANHCVCTTLFVCLQNPCGKYLGLLHMQRSPTAQWDPHSLKFYVSPIDALKCLSITSLRRLLIAALFAFDWVQSMFKNVKMCLILDVQKGNLYSIKGKQYSNHQAPQRCYWWAFQSVYWWNIEFQKLRISLSSRRFLHVYGLHYLYMFYCSNSAVFIKCFVIIIYCCLIWCAIFNNLMCVYPRRNFVCFTLVTY